MFSLVHRRAFSILELSIALVLVGLVAGIALKINPTLGGGAACYTKTQVQLADIQGALDRFVVQNHRFPVPAQRTVGSDNPGFGREAVLESDPSFDSKLSEKLKIVTDTSGGVTKEVIFGALPFQALGLNTDYAGDCWGNKFTYVVSKKLTRAVDYLGARDGVLTVNRPSEVGAAPTTFLNKAAYAVISHGADGLGAVKINYSPRPGSTVTSSSEQKWCVDAPEQTQKTNCAAGSLSIVTAGINDGKKSTTAGFDDLVIFKAKQKTQDCLWDGAIISEGSSVTAYLKGSGVADCDAAANKETRTCTGGVLSGGYAFGTCVGTGDCNDPSLGIVRKDASKTAYLNATAATDAACNSTTGTINKETRTCTAGVLSGSFTHLNCLPTGTCTTPWGTSVANGASVTAYAAATAVDCSAAGASEVRHCSGGSLDGSFTNASCAPLGSCPTPWGAVVTNGSNVDSYSTNTAPDCTIPSVYKSRNCAAGVLSPGYNLPTCTAPKNCTTPWGAVVMDGSSVPAYSTNVSDDCAGSEETRTCTSGVLSGGFTYASCNKPKECLSPWGGAPIANGATVDAYSASTAADCSTVKESRTCTDGALSGSFTFGSCSDTVARCAGGTFTSLSRFGVVGPIPFSGGSVTVPDGVVGSGTRYSSGMYSWGCASIGGDVGWHVGVGSCGSDGRCGGGYAGKLVVGSAVAGTWTLGAYSECVGGTETASYSCVGGACSGAKPADVSRACVVPPRVDGECGFGGWCHHGDPLIITPRLTCSGGGTMVWDCVGTGPGATVDHCSEVLDDACGGVD